MDLVNYYFRDTMELHEFFMQVPIPLVIMSGSEHIFTLTNKAYEDLFDRPAAGSTFAQTFDPEVCGFFVPVLDKVYQTGETFKGKELCFPKKIGSGLFKDHWVNVEYFPFLGTSGKIIGVIGFFTDVTDVVKARIIVEKSERFYRKLNLEMEKESELKEIFVSTLSHDLRTPLTIAKLGGIALAKNLIELPGLYKIAVRISVSMTKADKMIQNLLDASFIKAGEKLPIKISPCCMNSIIETVLDELSSIHENRFIFHSAEQVNGFWDEQGISRVLENLLLNAIKYGSKIALVSITLSIVDNKICIRIHNEGDLIPPEELETLFNRFKRVKNTISTEQKGWGLGLTLVKGIVEAHGGTVRVRSIIEDGTTFYVALPLDSSGIYN